MTPIVSYLKEGRLPKEKDKARKLRVRSARYVLMDEVLYMLETYVRHISPM